MGNLNNLCDINGMSVDELIEECLFDGVSDGICTNKGCDYITEVEPDCYNGYCENCHTNTVKSAPALLGVI